VTDWLYLPPWGIRLVAVTGVILVALAAVRAFRERGGVPLRRQAVALVLRCLAIGALLWVALNPTALRPREIPGKPSLALLVDTSYSMSTSDEQGDGRLAAALRVLQEGGALAALGNEFTLDARSFDTESRAADLADLTAAAAQGRASDLGAAISSAVGDLAEGPSQAGILLVSDGRVTTEGALDAARLALARSVPLWTWCLGGEVPRRDLWLEVPSSEVLAFAGTEVEVAATLRKVGYESRGFRVEVLKDGTVVESLDVVPGPGDEAPVTATITAPDAGEHRYVFHVLEDKDEAEKDNNERSVFLRVVGEKVRVLLAEGQPHWDTKFLVQCLKRNPRVDLTALYRLGADRQFAVVSAEGEHRREKADLFPRTAEAFARYDVIIMGRGCEAFFDDETEEHLTDFVARHGGGLVFCRGKPYGGRFQPLAKLEPVVWGTGVMEGVRLVPTGAGRASPVFELAAVSEIEPLLERLPPFDQAMHTVGVKPLAAVLARGEPLNAGGDDGPVVMAYQLYGQGRVVTLNASGLWRWAFREKGSADEEVVYDRLWGALLRWLLSSSDFLAGHDVALRSERRLYTDEQQMRFLIRTRGLDEEAYRSRLSIRGGEVVSEVEPRPQAVGSYMAEAGPFPAGTYEITLKNNVGEPPEMTMTVEVVSSSIENRLLSADPGLMRQLAQISEGRVMTAAQVGRLGDIVRQWQARRELAEQKITLWDHWALLAAMMLVLAAEWFRRRREGLL